MAHVDAAAAAAHQRGNRIAEVIVFFALVVVSPHAGKVGTAAGEGFTFPAAGVTALTVYPTLGPTHSPPLQLAFAIAILIILTDYVAGTGASPGEPLSTRAGFRLLATK